MVLQDRLSSAASAVAHLVWKTLGQHDYDRPFETLGVLVAAILSMERSFQSDVLRSTTYARGKPRRAWYLKDDKVPELAEETATPPTERYKQYSQSPDALSYGDSSEGEWRKLCPSMEDEECKLQLAQEEVQSLREQLVATETDLSERAAMFVRLR